MKRCLLFLFLFLGLNLPTLAEPAPTQEEVDVLVEQKMFRFIHHDDWTGAIRAWKKRGVTDEMFAEAYIKIAKRYMDAPEGTEESRKGRSAIMDGIRTFASREQLTNLVYIVENTRQDFIRQDAVSAYYRRNEGSQEFLDLAEKVLARKDLSLQVVEQVFLGLELDVVYSKSVSPAYRKRALAIARGQIEKAGVPVVAADGLLSRSDPDYPGSPLQKKAIKQILDPVKSPMLKARKDWRDETLERYRKMQKNLEMR